MQCKVIQDMYLTSYISVSVIDVCLLHVLCMFCARLCSHGNLVC